MLVPWFAERTLAEVGRDILGHRRLLRRRTSRSGRSRTADPRVIHSELFRHRRPIPAAAPTGRRPRRSTSATAARLPPLPAPALGQHTDEILADVLGLPDHEIGRLHDKGVVAGP